MSDCCAQPGLLSLDSALQRLLTLCAASPWIAEQITRFPLLLDELLNEGRLFSPPLAPELAAELRDVPGGLLPLLQELLAAAEQTHHRLQATGAPFEAKDALKARGYRWDGQQRVWGTTLRSEAALADELAWLADAVYSGPTRVRVESLSARQRYSNRGGAPVLRVVGSNPLGV